jgi:hypothetical protein
MRRLVASAADHLLLLIIAITAGAAPPPPPPPLYSLSLQGGDAANHTTGRRYAYDSDGRGLAHFQATTGTLASSLQRCEDLCSSEPRCRGLTLNTRNETHDCYTVNDTKAVGTYLSGVSYLRHPAPVAAAKLSWPVRGWSISCGLSSSSPASVSIYPGVNLLTEGAPVVQLPSLASRGVSVLARRDVELPFRAGPDGHAPCRFHDAAGSAACLDTLAELYSTTEPYARWSGIGLDEWTLNNRTDWPHTGGAVANASAILQAGFREGRRRNPESFAAAWVSGPDDAFAELMHDGTFDLCMIEGYSVCWLPNHCSPTIEGYFPRLEWARREGFINRTLFAFGWLVSADADGPFQPPLNATHPKHLKPRCDSDGCDNPNGWTVPTLNASMRRLKAAFPEMPGVLMWGGDRGGCGKASLELIRAASELSAELWPSPPATRPAVGLKSDDTNMITNPNFEQTTPNDFASDWLPGSVYSRVTDTVRSPATAALKYVNRSPKTYQICSQHLPADVAAGMAGKRFNASAWIKAAGITGTGSGATIAVEFGGPGDGQGVPGSVCVNQTATGCATYLAGAYPDGVTGTHDWRLVSAVVQFPDLVEYVHMDVYVRSGMTGTAWFDAISLVEIPFWLEMTTLLLSPVYRGRIVAAKQAAGAGCAAIAVRAHLDFPQHDDSVLELVRLMLCDACGALTLYALRCLWHRSWWPR